MNSDPKILPQTRVGLRGRNLSPEFAGSYSFKNTKSRWNEGQTTHLALGFKQS